VVDTTAVELLVHDDVIRPVVRGQATNTNFIVFGFTQRELEPTIYRTRGEHANHFATDATCSRHDIADKNAELALNNNHSLTKIAIYCNYY
jgi:hypothetical protein